MPESYELQPERRRVVCRAWGTLTDGDLRSHYERLLTDPRFDRRMNQLADLSGVAEFTVHSETIEAAARMDVFARGTRRAFYAPRGIAFGLARMFSAYSNTEGQDVEVFDNLPDAERWLDEGHPIPR